MRYHGWFLMLVAGEDAIIRQASVALLCVGSMAVLYGRLAPAQSQELAQRYEEILKTYVETCRELDKRHSIPFYQGTRTDKYGKGLQYVPWDSSAPRFVGSREEWHGFIEQILMRRYPERLVAIRKKHLSVLGLLNDQQRAAYRKKLEHLKQTDVGWGEPRFSSHSFKADAWYRERRIALFDELIKTTYSSDKPAEQHLDDASFRSANVVATGRIPDDKLKWRLEGELDRIQQRYDLIASQVEAGRYDQARRNIELLRQALPAAGELVAQVQAGGDACEVLLIGLPTDAAMARIAELEEKEAESRAFFDHVQGERIRINKDLFRARTETIDAVWRAMLHNIMEWHSLPEWFELPSRLKDMHEQSKEQSGQLRNRFEVIRDLESLQAELDGEMRKLLDRHRTAIRESLDALEPVPELDSLVQSVVSAVDWARWTPGDRGK